MKRGVVRRRVWSGISVILLIVLFLFPLCARAVYGATDSESSASSPGAEQTETYTSLEDFAGKRIGVMTGAIQGPMVEKQIPTAEISYYNNHVDMLTALRQGKIDAYADSDIIVRHHMIEHEDLTYLRDVPLADPVEIGAIFKKTNEGGALREAFNAYLKEIADDGTLKELDSIWYGRDESRKTIKDAAELPATNGTLTLATDLSVPPVSYVKDNNPAGLDIDIAVRFCEARGYGLEIMDMRFAGIVDAVASGKCDFGIGGIAITEERAESVDFSDPMYQGNSVLAFIDPSYVRESGSFLTSMKESFTKTFLREDRYKLFLSGIGTTLLITGLSILFGTALGFAVYMLCRGGSRPANAVTRFCVWIIRGLPVVVMLMIFYYIIFGRAGISGTAVSVVVFTLIFAAAVYSMMRSGVDAVDRGQVEAAYALGYTDGRAFFRIILPQAMPHIMPAFRGQITALIKATAVVGYIAVQDLTKMGDIVRSRTYEAFFPLIAVAVIYFVLAGILIRIVSRIELRVDPRRRRENAQG